MSAGWEAGWARPELKAPGSLERSPEWGWGRRLFWALKVSADRQLGCREGYGLVSELVASTLHPASSGAWSPPLSQQAWDQLLELEPCTVNPGSVLSPSSQPTAPTLELGTFFFLQDS